MRINFTEKVGGIVKELNIEEALDRANEYTIIMTTDEITLDEYTRSRKQKSWTIGGDDVPGTFGEFYHFGEWLGIFELSRNKYEIGIVDDQGNNYTRPLTQGLIIDYGIAIVNELIF